MFNSRKNNLLIIMSWMLVFIWMLIIFLFSNQVAEDSNALSTGVLNTLISFFDFGIDLEIMSVLIRKLAHFSVYFMLGFFVLNAIKKTIGINNSYLLTTIVCFVYACSDEIHQFFVPGRSCEFTDVLIDMSGVILFLIIYSYYKRFKNKSTLL